MFGVFFFSGIKLKASELLHYCANHHILKISTFPRKERSITEKKNQMNK